MNSPHDKLIKSVFANEKNAIEFFSKQLPQELVEAFNMSSLKIEPGNFVDSNLQKPKIECSRYSLCILSR